VAGVANTFQPTANDTYKSDREMSTCEMQEQVDLARRDVESAAGDARLVIENDLRRLAGLAPLPPRIPAGARDPRRAGPSRRARERAATYEVEIHKKYAIAVACLVFALVGAPIALRFQRGGVGLVLGVSVAVFTVYYIGLIGGEELGDRLLVSPFLAMWTPNLI